MCILFFCHMKRHLIVQLSTLFSIAAIGLIILQITQTQRSAQMSDNLFNISVNNSMDHVFDQIDQMEVEDYLTQKERYRILLFRRIDEMNEKMQDLIRQNSGLFYDEQRVNLGISTQDSALVQPNASVSEAEVSVLSQYNTLLNARNRLLTQVSSSEHDDNGRAPNSIDPTKLNFAFLDSLIREELVLNGVDIKPDIGIMRADDDTLLFCSEKADSVELLNSTFKYSFHNNHFTTSQETLVILHFPHSPLLLSADITPYTLISIFMILLITFLFVFSIRTNYNQRKLDEMKTDFVNNMTHEIKTPIATIGLACEMLNDESISNDPASLHNFVDIISNENRRMRVLIETLLQSAKMSSKKFTISPKEIQINDIIESSVESFQLAIKNRNGYLETDLNPISGTLYADELHISNTIHNLIDNAIKYSSDNLYIKITTYEQDHHVVLKIQDHGIGISKDDQKHIFEKFYRVSTGDVHNVKGFGIGLNYVYQVVAIHQGKISLESELGQGSTFTILLPLD